MEIEAFRNLCEVFCAIYDDCTEEDVLLHEEEIRSAALEEAKTEKEKQIIQNSDLIIIPHHCGGFYVEFEGFH